MVKMSKKAFEKDVCLYATGIWPQSVDILSHFVLALQPAILYDLIGKWIAFTGYAGSAAVFYLTNGG